MTSEWYQMDRGQVESQKKAKDKEAKKLRKTAFTTKWKLPSMLQCTTDFDS